MVLRWRLEYQSTIFYCIIFIAKSDIIRSGPRSCSLNAKMNTFPALKSTWRVEHQSFHQFPEETGEIRLFSLLARLPISDDQLIFVAQHQMHLKRVGPQGEKSKSVRLWKSKSHFDFFPVYLQSAESQLTPRLDSITCSKALTAATCETCVRVSCCCHSYLSFPRASQQVR